MIDSPFGDPRSNDAPTRVLSFHAEYRCQNSGACCTAGWVIPVEEDYFRVRGLEGEGVRGLPGERVSDSSGERVRDGHAPPYRGGHAPPYPITPLPPHLLTRSLPVTPLGCAFHRGHSCAIHSALGHEALPLACRQFPRVSVLEPRGASIVLSCFCPTALAMLDDRNRPIADHPIADHPIEDHPIAITILHSPIFTSPEGLDARTSLPPALRPDVLMDWDSWWEFERLAVDACNRVEPLRAILARLSIAVEHVRTWQPGRGELVDAVRAAFTIASMTTIASTGSVAALHRRFLACHAFASWPAHLGAGLRTWLRSLETVVFLLENGWTIRDIDLWLRHFADPERLVAAWRSAETMPPVN